MEKIKRNPIVHGFKCSQAQWDKIFDPATRPAEETKPEVKPEVNAPAIHTDATYTKKFDWGAGRKWNSGAERKEWMKRGGHECRG